MPDSRPRLTGQDLRGAMRMAAEDMGAVQKDIRQLAEESRFTPLGGDERKDFFRNLNQDEFDMLHALANSMGPMGLNALERVMKEAESVYREDK